MTDGSSLLQAVVDQPEDDGVRLVYADWLEENGDDDRAEFIRAQIRLAGMNLWDDGYTALDVRCRQLERAHPEWLGQLEPFVKQCERFCGGRAQAFQRGFPVRVELTPQQFITHCKYLLSQTPVRDVRLTMDNDTRNLTRQRELAKLTAAEFAYVRDSASARKVLACLKRFANLRHFGLIGSRPREQEASEIFQDPTLGSVQSLTLMGTRLPQSAEAIFASHDWPNLRRLVRIWVAQLDWLRHSWVSQLEALTISDTEPTLSPEQRRFLADLLPTTAIRQLSLGWWAMDVPGGQALGEAIARSSVHSLAVAQTHLTTDVARALITPISDAALNALYFSWATLDAELVERLLGTQLRVCALDHVTVETLTALELPPGFPELADLRLGLFWRQRDDPFTERLRAVLEAGTLPHLMSLTLCDTTPHRNTTRANWDRLAQMLANCPASAGLRELQLEAVTRTGALALANSPYLDGLQILNARVWPQDKDAESALTQRFGARVFLGIVNREF